MAERTFGTLRAYEPGILDRMRWGLQDALTPIMGGDARRAGAYVDARTTQPWNQAVGPVLETLTPYGDYVTAQEAVDEYNQGNYGTAAMLGSLAAIGMIPAAGDVVAKAGKKAVKGIRHGGSGISQAEREALIAARNAPKPEGIRAYHGSPHDFDQFSLDKIGTGEGAQAYGHGLYKAEEPDVARGYRDTLLLTA